MLQRSFKPAKCKTALKLATSRIKLMKNKKENHLKQLKKELAQLLGSGQDQTARIRVEHVVREEKIIAAYDLIDIYCELIVARLPIIESQKNCPIDLKEAVASVVFAAPRCADIPELQDVRKHFIAKYGKEFVGAAIELRPECGVSRILVEKLSANAPDGQTKLKILTAIAEEHNVEWDPKTFGQKESKPYDDLLKGPNTFDMASKVHSEPPIVQEPPFPPNLRASQGRDQRHSAPVNYQQNLHSSSSQNFAPSDFSGGQSAPSAAPRPPLRPSVTEYERTEIRHSHLRDENAFSLDQQNWNMEFKDATAAAQAAAESAERASMAARAAAELSSREKITRQHSNELHKSNAHGMRDDKPRKNNDSPSEKFVKVGNYYSPQERNPKPSMRTEDVDGYVDESHYDADERSYKGDHISAKRYDQSASSRSGTGSISVDSKITMNNFREVGRYSRKSSFEEKEAKPENSASLSGTRVNKQSSGKDRSNYSRSSSSSDGDNYVNSPSHQNFVFNDDENPFGHGKSWKETVESGDIGSVEAVFDSYVSDDEIIKFDKLPQYDEQESNFYSASIFREPSNHFAVNIEKGSSWENSSGSSKKHPSASRVSEEIFSSSQYDQSSPKAPSFARSKDLAPVTFDDSSGPSSDSEGDRKYVEVASQNKHGEELSSLSRTRFDYDEMSSSRSSAACRNSKVSSNEMSHRLSPQSSRLSSVNEVTSVSTDTMKKEVFDQLRSESGEELKFSKLTIGLWNKEYNAPPYRNNPSGDSLSLKGATEDGPTYIRNVHDSPRVESSSFTSKMGQKVEENSSSRTRFQRYDLGTDDIKEELPQQNLQSKREQTKEKSSLSSRIENCDLGTDDVEKDLPKPKLANKPGRKEDYTKSKFSAPVGYFDSDGDESEEDLPKRPSTFNVRADSGFSRRPKANPNSEASFHPKTKHGSPASVNSSSVSENKPDFSESRPKPRPRSEKHSTTRASPEEKQKQPAMEQSSSPLKPATSSGTETSRTSSGEAPSRESSLKKASHVHPKLPDYDSIVAHFLSLRKNRS